MGGIKFQKMLSLKKIFGVKFALFVLVLLALNVLNLAVVKRAGVSIVDANDSVSEFQDCSGCPVMVVVPGGEFLMGANRNNSIYSDAALPVHRVSIGYSLAVGKYEITQKEYDLCVAAGECSYRPNYIKEGGSYPASKIGFQDAQKYIDFIKNKTGKMYRLPSEAEWEYFARAGSTKSYHWGNKFKRDKAACTFCISSNDRPAYPSKVGSFQPNKFGLYDITGNVEEWVQDCGHKNYLGAPTDGSAWGAENNGNCNHRVYRGGSYKDLQQRVQVWVRGRGTISQLPKLKEKHRKYANDGSLIHPMNRGSFRGFRVVREIN